LKRDGALAIQTMFVAPIEGAETSNGSTAATGGVAGALVGGPLRG
jgi:hypothetical protein